MLLTRFFWEGRRLAQQLHDIIFHVPGLYHVRVVAKSRPAVSADQELLKVPRDVADLQRLVEQPGGIGKLCEGGATRALEEGEERDLIFAIDVHLLEHPTELGLEPPARPHVADAVHELLGGGRRLLLAKLIAGVSQYD